MNLQITGKLSKFFTNPAEFNRAITRGIEDASFIAEAEYKREIPVDTGVARASVTNKINGLFQRQITATARTKSGKNYLEFVYNGTSKYKGSNEDVGRVSRVRSRKIIKRGRRGKLRAMTRKEEQIMFAGMAKRGVKFSIKPNKFVDRAVKGSKPRVYAVFNKTLGKFINSYDSINKVFKTL